MKITVELTTAERTSFGRFFSAIGVKNTMETISKETDQQGVFSIKNRIDPTGNYVGIMESKEGVMVDIVAVLEKYSPLANSIVASFKAIYLTGKSLFTGLSSDLQAIEKKYKEETNEPYGSFTTPSIYEKEVNNHVA
jgi:hypothetical protein